MHPLIRKQTIHRKVLMGYGLVIFVAFCMLVAGFFELGRIMYVGKGTIPLLDERKSGDEALAALAALDASIERFDRSGGTAETTDNVRKQARRLRDATDAFAASAVKEESIVRVGSFKVIVERLASAATALPDLAREDTVAQEAAVFALSREARANLSAIMTTTSEVLDARVRNTQGIVEFAWSMLLWVEGFLLMLGIFMAIKGSELIATPVARLKDMATRIAKGEYDARAIVETDDEIGDLAFSFNAMADRMTHYNRELEREVAERTKSLDEKVEALRILNHDLDESATLLIRRDLELSQANERLRELDRLKSEFLSVAAHQLRTPLSAVKWVFNLVLEERMGKLNDEQKSFLMKGKESNERMVRLVDDMLTVTRIESGRSEYTFYKISVKSIIDDLTPDFTAAAETRGIRLLFDVNVAEPTDAMVDTEKIRFVFDNLIDNALKYTPSGGTVTVTLRRADQSVVLTVADTGIGIPDAEQRNIFAKFFRATNAVKVVTDGNGLGLFVVKTIVERHGGTVAFQSIMGQGSTFTVTLPVAPETGSPVGARTPLAPGASMMPGRSAISLPLPPSLDSAPAVS